MKRALIGATGFVGSNLRRLQPFDAFYHSQNIDEIRGQVFDEIVCAGAPAEKWKANQNPDADRASIERLVAALSEAQAAQFVLISTVDAYPSPIHVDESTLIDVDSSAPYGRHRRLLEEQMAEQFTRTTVLRLPALFGPGLKKNAIFDLLHEHGVDEIDGRGVFQFYDVVRLGDDLRRAVANNISLLNVATEPIAIAEIAREFFSRSLRDGSSAVPPRYDVRSRHAEIWGGSDGYLLAKAEVLQDLGKYIAAERGGRA